MIISVLQIVCFLDGIYERCKKHDFEIMLPGKDREQKSRISLISRGGAKRKYCFPSRTESKNHDFWRPSGAPATLTGGMGNIPYMSTLLHWNVLEECH